MEESKNSNVDEYIASFSGNTQRMLEEIRSTIQKAAPEATELISYAMPTYKLNGNLIHFAAFKSHIGIYPTPTGIEAFKEELSSYKSAKGSVQFPLDQPLPMALIQKIVEYRVKENLGKKS
jgi:uncharacterized protein YdhG (YjbR/CyaY superfamily)